MIVESNIPLSNQASALLPMINDRQISRDSNDETDNHHHHHHDALLNTSDNYGHCFSFQYEDDEAHHHQDNQIVAGSSPKHHVDEEDGFGSPREIVT